MSKSFLLGLIGVLAAMLFFMTRFVKQSDTPPPPPPEPTEAGKDIDKPAAAKPLPPSKVTSLGKTPAKPTAPKSPQDWIREVKKQEREAARKSRSMYISSHWAYEQAPGQAGIEQMKKEDEREAIALTKQTSPAPKPRPRMPDSGVAAK